MPDSTNVPLVAHMDCNSMLENIVFLEQLPIVSQTFQDTRHLETKLEDLGNCPEQTDSKCASDAHAPDKSVLLTGSVEKRVIVLNWWKQQRLPRRVQGILGLLNFHAMPGTA